MNLRTKILLPVMLLIVFMCGVSGYMSHRSAAESLRNALVGNMRGEAEALARAINDMANDALTDIERIALRNELHSFFTTMDVHNKAVGEGFTGTLKNILGTYPGVERIALVDLNGIIVASSDPTAIGQNFNDRVYVQLALKGQTNLSQPLKSRVTGKGVILAAAPVKQNDKIMGVVYTALSLETISETAVKPIIIGKRGYAYILAANGQVAAHKNTEMLFNTSLNGFEHYKEMASASSSGMLDFVGASGTRVFAYHVNSERSGLTAVAQAEYDDVFSGLTTMRDNSIMVGVGAVILAVALILLILRPVLRDVNAGMIFAGKVAAGDLSATLTVNRTDELGKLADALRSIPNSLKEIVAEYRTLEENIEAGQLDATGDHSCFSGEFATLIKGTNAILHRFRMVVDAIPSPTFMLDKDLKIRYMNTIAISLAGTGYHGKTCAQVFNRDDHGGPSCALTRAAATGKPASAETVAHPGGKTLDISYTSIPMLDSQGKLASVLQLIIDLTQIKSTQRTIMDVAGQAMGITERVAAASKTLAAQVAEVSRGTDVQRDRVGSTATAMEEMNATVMEVARNAGEASEQAEATRKQAADGAELVNKVIAAVQRVNSVAGELENNMQTLGKQAESIGGVMNMISDIADQTNLLALNAAIEAARAGDAGRGFAVVADEVRKLAEKTMSATTEVGSSIRGIQSSTATNIQRVTEAGKSVVEATELAITSGAALQEIVSLAGRNSALITGIATAAEEQSATSEEVNRSVEEINRIAGDTASGMSESSSAVSELSHMAQELKVILDKLKA